MKVYQSIDTKPPATNMNWYVFDKLDGSNIRAEWSRKRGFDRYGSRRKLIDRSDVMLGKSIPLIQNKYEEVLDKRFRKLRYDKVTCYFEFSGPNSFAGNHLADDDHDVVLFDVDIYKHGVLEPKLFLKHFGDLDTPKLIHTGNVNQILIDQIKNNLIDGVTEEGVVCKAVNKKRTVMFKIKTKTWLDRLKNYCKGDENLFKQLL